MAHMDDFLSDAHTGIDSGTAQGNAIDLGIKGGYLHDSMTPLFLHVLVTGGTSTSASSSNSMAYQFITDSSLSATNLAGQSKILAEVVFNHGTIEKGRYGMAAVVSDRAMERYVQLWTNETGTVASHDIRWWIGPRMSTPTGTNYPDANN